jgi:polysaccharide chain length determinant protein (PEP-CTERM system associated)
MLGGRELKFDDYIAIARRRLWWILVPTVLAPIITYVVSLRIPNRYTSQTLVLVEQQKVPDNFVKPVVTEDLNARLATMQEQILSRTRLQPIIENFGLFKSDYGKLPMEQLVERMRKSIKVTPIRSEVETRRDMPGFYISFTSDSPTLAQKVCAELTSMFMTENLKAREQSAVGTTDFLKNQLEDAKRKLDEQDAKLAQFKRKYLGQLPDQEQTNLSMLATLNTQLDAVTQAINRIQQDKSYVESLLAQQLATWQNSRKAVANPDNLEHQLSALQSQLVTLQSKYTEDHPDIIKLKKEIAQLTRQFNDSAAAADTPEAPKAAAVTEPAQIQQLRLQVHQFAAAIKERSGEQDRLRKQVGLYQSRVQLSPMVEEEYKSLTRDYASAQRFHDELLGKVTQSEMATDLERRQQGEQFRVVDPPNLPEKPTFPDRQMFVKGGLAGGFALGLGIALLLEMRDKSLRSDRDVEFYLQLRTLAMVPTIGAPAERRLSRVRIRRRSKKPPQQAVGA